MSSDTSSSSAHQTVQVISSTSNGSTWHPQQGQETSALIINLNISQQSKSELVNSAISILSRCIDPNLPAGNNTGIVIGHVQSGKTMSFTSIATLARDNKYQIVIVITGTSVPLFDQSSRRLDKDLRLQTRQDRKWVYLPNPNLKGSDLNSIRNTLADWADPNVPDTARKTILIAVMKHTGHLAKLIQLLKSLNLVSVPALIIDDEADQAGLNTKVKQGTESTTYQRLISLRACFPHYSFLQYTATPQAPLLISLIDQLSPRFAHLLTPGTKYTGGKQFFLENTYLVKTIDEDDIPSENNQLVDPPSSLLYAMRLFFLGVAAGIYEDPDKAGSGNRSMLVHPSQKTLGHKLYLEWVSEAKKQWEDILEPNKKSLDLQDLQNDFKLAYDELEQTEANLPSFTGLMSVLLFAIRGSLVTEVNASRGKTPEIKWAKSYSWILVGGQAMDRGYTVEGLTVTYMPRGIGVGNADTVQQRARFFGYKKDYLGYCRIFLGEEARQTYTHYVEHEEDVRERLSVFSKLNKPLTEWKRTFFLDRTLKPTRENVLDLDYMKFRESLSDDWYWAKAPHASIPAVTENRTVIDNFFVKINLLPDQGHPLRSVYAQHEIDLNVPLDLVFKYLLVPLRLASPSDSTRHTGFLIQIEKYLQDHKYETCAVYAMSKGANGWTERERKTDDNDEIASSSIFQGEQPDQNNPKFKKGDFYQGDRKMRQDGKLSIQIHKLKVINRPDGPEVSDVPFVVVWVPAKMAKGWYAQAPA